MTNTTQEELCIAAVTELLGKYFCASMRYGQLRTGGYDPRTSTAYAEVRAVKDQITSTVRSYFADSSPSSFGSTPPAEQPAATPAGQVIQCGDLNSFGYHHASVGMIAKVPAGTKIYTTPPAEQPAEGMMSFAELRVGPCNCDPHIEYCDMCFPPKYRGVPTSPEGVQQPAEGTTDAGEIADDLAKYALEFRWSDDELREALSRTAPAQPAGEVVITTNMVPTGKYVGTGEDWSPQAQGVPDALTFLRGNDLAASDDWMQGWNDCRSLLQPTPPTEQKE